VAQVPSDGGQGGRNDRRVERAHDHPELHTDEHREHGARCRALHHDAAELIEALEGAIGGLTGRKEGTVRALAWERAKVRRLFEAPARRLYAWVGLWIVPSVPIGRWVLAERATFINPTPWYYTSLVRQTVAAHGTPRWSYVRSPRMREGSP